MASKTCLLLGGPMHGVYTSVPENDRQVIVAVPKSPVWSPYGSGLDFYTVRYKSVKPQYLIPPTVLFYEHDPVEVKMHNFINTVIHEDYRHLWRGIWSDNA